MPESLQTMHVVISASGAGSLRQALRAAGRRKERIVAFPDHLSYGPIDPPDPESRLDWMVAALGHERTDWDWLPEHVNEFWRRASEPAARTVVWTSSRSADEHAAFLAWVERMDGQPYDVADLGDIEITKRYKDGRQRRDKAVSLGLLPPEAIVEAALWDLARPLDAFERMAHLSTWRRLRTENAPLRIIGPDGLKSAPISAFDASLLSYASDQWQRAIRLIGSVMAFEFPDYFQVDDHILAARLVHLIATGELESRLPAGAATDERGYHFALTTLPRDTEVRLPPT